MTFHSYDIYCMLLILQQISLSCMSIISTQGDFALWGTSGNIWRHFQFSQLGKEVQLSSSGYKPGMLLNILSAQDSSSSKNSLAPNANSAKFVKLRFMLAIRSFIYIRNAPGHKIKSKLKLAYKVFHNLIPADILMLFLVTLPPCS